MFHYHNHMLLRISAVILSIGLSSFSSATEKNLHSLYADFTSGELAKIAKKENECYIKQRMSGDTSLQCELITEQRLRFIQAYNISTPDNPATVIADTDTLHELSVPAFIEQVPTKSAMAKAGLTSTLCSPTTIKQELEERKARQQFLENNLSLAHDCKDALRFGIVGEQALLDLWNVNKRDRMKKSFNSYAITIHPIIKKYVPCVDSVEESASALNVKTTLKVLYPVRNHMVKKVLVDSWSGIITSMSREDKDNHHLLSILGAKVWLGVTQSDPVDVAVGIAGGVLMGMSFLSDAHVSKSSKTTIKSFLGFIPYVVDSIDVARNAYNLYQDRTSEPAVAAHQSLIEVANYMRAAGAIYNTMKDNAEFQQRFPQFVRAYELVRDGATTKDLMCDLVHTETFKGEPSAFSNVGRIALVSERLVNAREEIIPLMRAMGELESYLAFVDFKKQHSDSVPYIYTDPHKEHTAYIQANKYMHPAVPSSKPNTLALGGDRPLSAVVTGPNGCGKSFGIKGLAADTLLSQTFGVAPAHTFKHSLVDEVFYIANVKDEAGVESRYQAEVRKIGEVYGRILEAARNGKTMLVIMDEPLSATNARGGAAGLREFIKRVDATPNNNSVRFIITHHDLDDTSTVKQRLLAMVERNVQHYQVKDGEGKYKLVEGQSAYSNAAQLVHDELDRVEKEFQKRYASRPEQQL